MGERDNRGEKRAWEHTARRDVAILLLRSMIGSSDGEMTRFLPDR